MQRKYSLQGSYETRSTRCSFGFGCFFLQFRERINSFYPELFGEQSGGSEYSATAQFGFKWGWYNSIYALAKGDAFKIDLATKLPLHESLIFLCFEKEKNELEIKMLKK